MPSSLRGWFANLVFLALRTFLWVKIDVQKGIKDGPFHARHRCLLQTLESANALEGGSRLSRSPGTPPRRLACTSAQRILHLSRVWPPLPALRPRPLPKLEASRSWRLPDPAARPRPPSHLPGARHPTGPRPLGDTRLSVHRPLREACDRRAPRDRRRRRRPPSAPHLERGLEHRGTRRRARAKGQ